MHDEDDRVSATATLISPEFEPPTLTMYLALCLPWGGALWKPHVTCKHCPCFHTYTRKRGRSQHSMCVLPRVLILSQVIRHFICLFCFSHLQSQISDQRSHQSPILPVIINILIFSFTSLSLAPKEECMLWEQRACFFLHITVFALWYWRQIHDHYKFWKQFQYTHEAKAAQFLICKFKYLHCALSSPFFWPCKTKVAL